MKRPNRVFVFTPTTGTGTLTLNAEVSDQFMSAIEAGSVDGDVVTYCIEEGDDFEIGSGTIGGSVTTLTRTTVEKSKIAGVVGTTKMTLSGNATVRFILSAADILTLAGTPDGTLTTAKLAGSALVTEAEGLDSSDSDTSIPTTAATKDYVEKRNVLATAQLASGTAIDFTSIPADVKRIDITFVGVSTNGSSPIIVQLGDSGGVETTGYLGCASSIAASGTSQLNFTNGFGLMPVAATANIHHGLATVVALGSAFWAYHSLIALSNAPVTEHGAGAKGLSGTLDRIRITTSGGTDTFDAGSVSIVYHR